MEDFVREAGKIVTKNVLPSTYVELLGDPTNTTFGADKSQTKAEHYKSLVRSVFKESFDNQWVGMAKKPMYRFR
jgi:hypothetical protein